VIFLNPNMDTRKQKTRSKNSFFLSHTQKTSSFNSVFFCWGCHCNLPSKYVSDQVNRLSLAYFQGLSRHKPHQDQRHLLVMFL
jgi:hypothetical protein